MLEKITEINVRHQKIMGDHIMSWNLILGFKIAYKDVEGYRTSSNVV